MQLYGKCMETQHVNNRAGQLKKRSSKMEINWNIKTHNVCYNHTYTVSLIKSVFIPMSCSHSVAFLKPSLRSLRMCLFLIRSLSHHFFFSSAPQQIFPCSYYIFLSVTRIQLLFGLFAEEDRIMPLFTCRRMDMMHLVSCCLHSPWLLSQIMEVLKQSHLVAHYVASLF